MSESIHVLHLIWHIIEKTFWTIEFVSVIQNLSDFVLKIANVRIIASHLREVLICLLPVLSVVIWKVNAMKHLIGEIYFHVLEQDQFKNKINTSYLK